MTMSENAPEEVDSSEYEVDELAEDVEVTEVPDEQPEQGESQDDGDE